MHLDIVDYPGEWLLDLPLMSQDFEDWSEAALATARAPARRAARRRMARRSSTAVDPGAGRSTRRRRGALAAAFTGYLARRRARRGCPASRRDGS